MGRTITRKILLVGLAVIWTDAPSSGQASQQDRPLGFFAIRSQSPIQQLRFGIQHHPPWTVPKGKWAIQAQHTWKNIWLQQDDLFRMDGEVHELVIRSSYGLAERLEMMVDLPVRYLSGGVLDGLIEGFHNLIGIGQAARDKYPRDQFAMEAFIPETRGGRWFKANPDEAGWQVGNLVLSLTHSIVEDQKNGFRAVASGNLKLPTGSSKELFGSQSVDAGISVGIGRNFGLLTLFLNSGLVYFGDQKVLGLELRQWHLSTLMAFELHRSGSNHSWILQGLVESGVAINYSQFSERTSELMVGYKHRYSSGLLMEVGFLENLFYFDNSPDIAFHVALAKIL